MSRENIFPPLEPGEAPRGSVDSWVEGTSGVVALFGTVDYDMAAQIQAAADQHIQNPDVDRVVFDFLGADFLHAYHIKILEDAHNRTHQTAVKTMLLRNIEVGGDIHQLFIRNGKDRTFAMEGIHDLEGKDARMIELREPSDSIGGL
jgi:anti-anti-sigma regulatory factor